MFNDRDRAMFLLNCSEKERKLLQKQMRVVVPVLGDVPLAFDMIVDKAIMRKDQRRRDRDLTVRTRIETGRG